mgnify:CR=1 FL=1
MNTFPTPDRQLPLPLKLAPEDFVVEEVLRAEPSRTGDFALYRATKRLMTTPDLQQQIASQLGLPPRAVVFPALKDRQAVTTQHFTIRGRAPLSLEGQGFSAYFIGRMARHLHPSDLLGNRFTVRLPSLPPAVAEAVAQRFSELEHAGLPNYFDEQRFGSRTRKGTFIGKAILQGDAETALRAYLAEPAPGDPPALRSFKAFAAQHWRDWPTLFQHAPRSNHRSVLTFLKDHPRDFRKAVNLISPRLLPLMLAAYQSLLWNLVASGVLERRLEAAGLRTARIEIAGEPLVAYRRLPEALVEELRRLQIPLLHHRATFSDPLVEGVAGEVLAREGLALAQLKARLLRRAYLPRGDRPLLLFPQQTKAQLEESNESGKRDLRLSFFLPPGSYGTLVVKVLAATTPLPLGQR